MGIKQPIPALTYQLHEYITQNILDKSDEITIIGHSMGGVMALDLLQSYKDVREQTKAAITIASPLKGANNSIHLASIFSRSSTDMIKNSPFLENLGKNIHMLKDIPTLHLTASLDLLIPTKNTYFHTANALQQTIPACDHLSILFKKRTAQEINGWTQYKIFNGIDNIIKEISPKLVFTDIPQI
jgi:predicted esterase